MYTQCSKCETVFQLSAETLRAAGGQVRCGRCGEVFSALARLAEEATAFPPGESSLESETRADAILQSPAPLSPPAGSAPAPVPEVELDLEGTEIAHLRILDVPDDELDLDLDASLEFTLPPGELDRIFIETSPSPLQLLAASVKASAARAAPAPKIAAPTPAAPTPVAPTPVAPTPAAPAIAAAAPAAPTPAAPAQAAAAAVQSARPVPSSAQSTAAISGLTVSEDIRQEMLAGYRGAELPEINAPRGRRWPPAVWISAAAALTLLLIFQVVQSNKDWLSGHAPLTDEGGRPAALSAYQLRQWGVTGDPSANGTLRVRASIMNAAAQLQPYPLLRVTLADRFGARVGSREFEPAEYLGKTPVRMLAPGERVDATLNILDPGKDAEGFEIDVCIRTAERKIACAGDPAAAARAPK